MKVIPLKPFVCGLCGYIVEKKKVKTLKWLFGVFPKPDDEPQYYQCPNCKQWIPLNPQWYVLERSTCRPVKNRQVIYALKRARQERYLEDNLNNSTNVSFTYNIPEVF